MFLNHSAERSKCKAFSVTVITEFYFTPFSPIHSVKMGFVFPSFVAFILENHAPIKALSLVGRNLHYEMMMKVKVSAGAWAVLVGWCCKSQYEKSHLICLFVNLVSSFRESSPSHVVMCSLSTFIVHLLSQKQLQLRYGPLQLPFYSGLNRHLVASEGGKQQVTGVSDTVSLEPFSGLSGPNMLRPRGMCPGRVPLLCGVGRARM